MEKRIAFTFCFVILVYASISAGQKEDDFTFEDLYELSDNHVGAEEVIRSARDVDRENVNLIKGLGITNEEDPQPSGSGYWDSEGSGTSSFIVDGSGDGSGLVDWDLEDGDDEFYDLDADRDYGSGSVPSECRPGELQCLDGTCVDVSEKCNGFYTCPDGSDEWHCEDFVCPRGSFKCADGICIPGRLRCDNHRYCRDGSDEWNCTYKGCLPTEYQCSDGTCLPMEKRCDGYYDCLDYSEEEGCAEYSCLPGNFQCEDGICIPERLRCDGHNFCRDSSDEKGCNTSSPSRPPGGRPFSEYIFLFAVPQFQMVKEGQDVVFRCRDESYNRAPVEWFREDGNLLDTSRTTDILGRLTITNAKLSDAGVFVCKANGHFVYTTGIERAVTLYVQPYSDYLEAYRDCPQSYFTCRTTGKCVPGNVVCNGRFDCSDGSDEDRCRPQCEPDEFRCRNSKCVSFSWVCDSQDDCGDGSDENGCHVSGGDSHCLRDEFACTSNHQCTPKYMQCDNSPDCLDGSDEMGCSKPIIVESPICYLPTSIDGKFTLTCRAEAMPMPVVVWRLNWGYLPDTCTFESENGQGVLTCSNVGPIHQGAYSCEAVNYLGISFGRDAYVIIEPEEGAPNALTELCS